MTSRNLLRTPIRRYPDLSDWEALDLYAQRDLLSAQEQHTIQEEIKRRPEWVQIEAAER